LGGGHALPADAVGVADVAGVVVADAAGLFGSHGGTPPVVAPWDLGAGYAHAAMVGGVGWRGF